MGSRATEGSAPHGTETGRGDGEEGGGGRTEGAGGRDNVREIRDLGRGEVVDSLESCEEDFKIDSKYNWEPTVMLECRWVIWWNEGVLVMVRAAEFWTS